jgi:hypothetical protein
VGGDERVRRHAPGERDRLAAGEFVHDRVEGESRGDHPEAADDAFGFDGSVDGDRFGAAGVGQAVEETG